jgi:hypothetical protein
MKYIGIVFILYLVAMDIYAQETPKIKVTTGTASFVATTSNNATAKAFIALLPLTISMSELNGNEKYAFLSNNLPSAPENPGTIQSGDLMLYGSICLVLFYETFSTAYSYTKIGYIDKPAELKSALGLGNSTVTFELISTTGIKPSETDKIPYTITEFGELTVNADAKCISIVDMSGQKLQASTSSTLNVSGLSKGIYILMIECPGDIKTVKIKL